MSPREPRRCCAPVPGSERLCGALATETREVEELDVGLCSRHARELDADRRAEDAFRRAGASRLRS